jgi:drug/metabolite transporter (DMT)-like permease
VLNAVVIGISFLLVKLTLAYANPVDTLTYRFAAAFVMVSIGVMFGYIRLGYRGKPILALLLLALLYPIAYFILQTYGLKHASSAEGGIISAMTPVVTMIFAAIFLKERTTLLQKLSLLVSASGMVFIWVMNGSSDWTQSNGIILLLLACITLAGYNVLARVVTRHFLALEISMFMVGAACFSYLALSLSTHMMAGTLDIFLAPLHNSTFIALICCLGVFQVATAYMANFVLSRMEAARMSVFSHLSTIIAIAAGGLILQENVTWSHLAGAAMIISGVIGMNLPYKVAVSPKPMKQSNINRDKVRL